MTTGGLIPLLQIVHVSDLHFLDTQVAPSNQQDAATQRLKQWIGAARSKIGEGTSGHQELLRRGFFSFIEERIAANKQDARDPWPSVERWLVNTGDDTVYGDLESLEMARDQFHDPVRHYFHQCIHLRGNHDAWPGKLLSPWSKPGELATHRAMLDAKFPRPAPVAWQSRKKLGFSVALATADTVLYDRVLNFLALGRLARKEIDDVTARLSRLYAPNTLRILATHHPIHHPPNQPQGFGPVPSMRILNQRTTGEALWGSAKMPIPLVHLILSGHTHALFPDHGELPQQPSGASQPFLSASQFQFVSGTLLQDNPFTPKLRNGFEILRIYADPASVPLFRVHRLSVEWLRAGDPCFAFMEVPQRKPAAGKYEQEIVFTA